MQRRSLFDDPVGAARVAVTRDGDPFHQRRQAIDRRRPVERVRVGERRDGAVLEQVTGEYTPVPGTSTIASWSVWPRPR